MLIQWLEYRIGDNVSMRHCIHSGYNVALTTTMCPFEWIHCRPSGYIVVSTFDQKCTSQSGYIVVVSATLYPEWIHCRLDTVSYYMRVQAHLLPWTVMREMISTLKYNGYDVIYHVFHDHFSFFQLYWIHCRTRVIKLYCFCYFMSMNGYIVVPKVTW